LYDYLEFYLIDVLHNSYLWAQRLWISTQAWKQASGDPSGLIWNYRVIMLTAGEVNNRRS